MEERHSHIDFLNLSVITLFLLTVSAGSVRQSEEPSPW